MSHVARPADFHPPIPLYRAPVRTTGHRSLLRRVFDWMMDSRQQRVNREIEIFLARRGYRLTDSIERELNMHLSSGDLRPHR